MTNRIATLFIAAFAMNGCYQITAEPGDISPDPPQEQPAPATDPETPETPEPNSVSIGDAVAQPPSQAEVNVLTALMEGGAVLMSGQENAAAEIPANSGNLAATLDLAGTRTWDGNWVTGLSSSSGVEPPGIGALAGSFAYLLRNDHKVIVEVLGTPQPKAEISQLMPEALPYKVLRHRVHESTVTPKVMLWHQGEADAALGTSIEVYRDMMVSLITAWRQDYPSLEYMLVFQTAVDACGYDTTSVRKVQQSIADQAEDVILIDVDELTGTPMHKGCTYSVEGYVEQANMALMQLKQTIIENQVELSTE